jgi:hypothetical protein
MEKRGRKKNLISKALLKLITPTLKSIQELESTHLHDLSSVVLNCLETHIDLASPPNSQILRMCIRRIWEKI